MRHEDFLKAKQAELNTQWSSDSPEDYPPSADANMVDHPPHYNQAGIECIEAIQAALTPEEFKGYCKGNNFKYTWRENYKGKDEDLAKAAWYLNKYLSTLEGK